MSSIEPLQKMQQLAVWRVWRGYDAPETLLEYGTKASGNWGHAGVKGQQGGSAPGGLAGKLGQSVEGGGDAPWEDLKDYNKKLDHRALGFINKGVGEGAFAWRDATKDVRSQIKAQAVDEVSQLAEESGLLNKEECASVVTDMGAAWAKSSNDSSVASLSIQEDAAAEFGVEISSFQKQAMESAMGERIASSDTQRKALRAMYEHTQHELEAQGIGPDDFVELRRGFSQKAAIQGIKEGFYDDPELEGEKPPRAVRQILLRGNPLESWSVSKITANTFATNAATKQNQWGYVVSAKVRRRDIIGTCKTGLGCVTEGEFVVLGRPKKALVIMTCPPGGF